MKDILINPKPQFASKEEIAKDKKRFVPLSEIADDKHIAQMVALIEENKRIELEEKQKNESFWRQ